MKFISPECQITKEEARELLMLHQKSYLWNVNYSKWTANDLENLRLKKNIRNGISYKRHLRHQKVKVIFNDGTQKIYASVKGVAQKVNSSQSYISNVLNGRKNTTKFLSIQKI